MAFSDFGGLYKDDDALFVRGCKMNVKSGVDTKRSLFGTTQWAPLLTDHWIINWERLQPSTFARQWISKISFAISFWRNVITPTRGLFLDLTFQQVEKSGACSGDFRVYIVLWGVYLLDTLDHFSCSLIDHVNSAYTQSKVTSNMTRRGIGCIYAMLVLS